MTIFYLQVTLAENQDTPPGLILDNGDINWNCPCLGGMAVGPCGVEFRDAFSCFHYSQEEPKGKECLEKFAVMQECMKQYPELYEEKRRSADEEEVKEDEPVKEEAEEKEKVEEPKQAATDSEPTTAKQESEDKTVTEEEAATTDIKEQSSDTKVESIEVPQASKEES